SFRGIPSSLVVTPLTSLRRQITNDVQYRFWRRIDAQPPRPNRRIVQLFPRNASSLLHKTWSDGAIYVCTFQTLRKIKSEKRSLYNLLRKKISIVIIDEGH